jgi:arginase
MGSGNDKELSFIMGTEFLRRSIIMRTRVILSPYDSGHLRERMGRGPERIFEAGLKDLFSRLGIEFDSEEVAPEHPFPAEINSAFQLAGKISQRVRACHEAGIFPVVLSGNCNAAIGTVSGLDTENTGIVWFDGHGEATTPETTSSGFLDGMPISVLLGRAWQTLAKTVPGFSPIPGNRIVLFGARDLEAVEATLLEDAGVQQMATVEQLKKVLPGLAKKVEKIYVHVDLDVLDPSVARSNQWTPPDGISLETLIQAIREVKNHATIAALGIASFDPEADRDGKALAAAVLVAESVLNGS